MIIDFDHYRAPEAEIIGAIDYYKSLIHNLEGQIIDCEMNISKFQNILDNRANLKRHRERLNKMACQYVEKFERTLTGAYLDEIMKEFSVPKKQAIEIADLIRRNTRKYELNKRNAQIVLLSERLSLSEIANDFGISRQMVHRIVKQGKKDIF